jgi:hypothetical protein
LSEKNNGGPTSEGAKSHRVIDALIEGVDLTIEFSYDFTGDYVVESNYAISDPGCTDLWELESPDVRRQIEHACDQSLARDGRL